MAVFQNSNRDITTTIANGTGNLSVVGNLWTSANAYISGNLTVDGDVTYINITELNVEDPIISLGRGPNNTPLTANDGKDRGEAMWYYSTQEQTAFIGYKNSSGNLFAATDVTISNELVTVNSFGNFTMGNLYAESIESVGNITGGNLLTNGLVSANGNITGGNLLTSGLVTATGNITGGNVGTAGLITATGNIQGGNLLTSGLVTATGNIQGGNLLTSGLVTAAGNITGGNIDTTGLITATGNIQGGNLLTNGLVTATGNVTSGNLLTSGLVTATGNVTGGNLLTSGLISAAGNITGGNIGTTGNITGGNLTITGLANIGTLEVTSLSAPGNITGGNLLTGGLISATGNITGNNVSGIIRPTGGSGTNGILFPATTDGDFGYINYYELSPDQTRLEIGINDGVTTGPDYILLTSPNGVGINSPNPVYTLDVSGNIGASGLVTAAGNITGGNILTGGLISATSTITSSANITGGNVLTGGLISSTGNIQGGNIHTVGLISATGNIAGNFFTGNGSQLTGLYSNANASSFLASFGSNVISTTGNVRFGNVSATGAVFSSAISITGNVNITGNINATGNINYANVTDLVVGDPLIYFAANNTGNLFDIGWVGSYDDGVYQHTGLVRDHNDGVWKLFANVIPEPTTTIDWTNTTYPSFKSGPITSTGAISASGNITGGNIAGTMRPTAGTGANGIIFPLNPGGGVSDQAWIRYYVITGEKTVLDIGIADNSDDSIYLNASGGVGINNPNPSATLDVSGNILASGDITAFSDARLKTDVETIVDPLTIIQQLRGVDYTSIDTGHRSSGVIAQEIRSARPMLVKENDGYLSVNYNGFAGLFIESIKALTNQVEELQAEVKRLKGE